MLVVMNLTSAELALLVTALHNMESDLDGGMGVTPNDFRWSDCDGIDIDKVKIKPLIRGLLRAIKAEEGPR